MVDPLLVLPLWQHLAHVRVEMWYVEHVPGLIQSILAGTEALARDREAKGYLWQLLDALRTRCPNVLASSIKLLTINADWSFRGARPDRAGGRLLEAHEEDFDTARKLLRNMRERFPGLRVELEGDDSDKMIHALAAPGANDPDAASLLMLAGACNR